MSRIFWDTNLFIYLFEGREPQRSKARHHRERLLERRDELLTSAMTLAEVQVGPLRANDSALALRYRDAITSACTVVPFDERAAEIYARLRTNPAMKPPDAIQLSCAAAAGVELFVTNDRALQKLSVPGIHFISSLETLPLG